MQEKPASQQIDDIIAKHGGWKTDTLKQLRSVITAIDPGIIEEVKWKTPSRPEGLPVWSHDGMVCFAEIWKDNVKLLFPKGAFLKDPHKIFNARLKSSADRAIELHEGDFIDETALQALILEGSQFNAQKAAKSQP